MSKKVFKIIVVCLIVLLLSIPIFKEMSNNTGFKTIKYSDYKKAVENTESYKLALIYVAPKSIETTEESKEAIKEVLKDITKDDEEIKPYYIDSDELEADAIKELKLDETTGQAYIFASNGEAIKIVSGALSKEDLVKYVKLYSANGIDESLVKYRTAKSAETFMKRVKKDEVTMAVFGRDNCYYCQQFLPVVNTVADENKLEYVYYFDSNNYDEEEYGKIMDAGLTIPAECSSTGKKAKLEPGFGTPLTLFTKKGKVIDCISGYTSKSKLEAKLKTVGMIK